MGLFHLLSEPNISPGFVAGHPLALAMKQETKSREGQPSTQGTQHSKPLSEPQDEKPLSTSTLNQGATLHSLAQTGTHQDEETFVGKFLVLLNCGQHGQHQAAEDQQKSAIAARRGLDCCTDKTAEEPLVGGRGVTGGEKHYLGRIIWKAE